MSRRKLALDHLWASVVEAFVAGRFNDARNIEAFLTRVENMTDSQYTEMEMVL